MIPHLSVFSKALGANFLGQAIGLASRVLLIPLYVAAWGVELYGEWLIVTAIAAYVGLSDVGAGVYVVNRLTQVSANDDTPGFRAILNTALVFLTCGALVAALLMVVAGSLLPVGAWLGLTLLEAPILVPLVTLLGLQTAVSVPLIVLLGVYRAERHVARGAMAGNAQTAGQFVLPALALTLTSAGPLTVAALQLFVNVVVSLLVVVDLRAIAPRMELGLRYVRLGLIRTLAVPSLHFFAIHIASVATTQGTVIAVGALLGPAQAVMYASLRTMVHLTKSVVAAFSVTVWPEFTRLDATGSHRELAVLFRWVLRTTTCASAIAVVFFWHLGELVYNAWLGPEVPYSSMAMSGFLLYAMESSFWTAAMHLLMATNRYVAVSRLSVAVTVSSVVLTAVGACVANLPGAVAGLLASELALVSWTLPLVASKHFDPLTLRFFARETLPLVAAIVGCVAPWTVPFAMAALVYWWMRAIPWKIGAWPGAALTGRR